ncbi:MAG: hypothetical protein DME97_02710 [Verrucomicrobia bacterium]|nr:MAG: hypothetical protein DME97_02710 [Verrucomicrobiota bacterium]
MCRPYRFATNLGIFLLLVAGRLTLAAEEKELTALEIFDRTLAAFDNQRTALRDWQYYQTLTTHQFDGSGNVIARGTWQSIVRPGDPRPLEYIAERMEGKLSFFKSESASSAPASPASASPSPKSKPRDEAEEKNQSESAVEAVRKYNLRERYNWKRLPDENVAGEGACVIAFEPKPRQNARSREERFFSLLAGKLWVSRSDFVILKMEVALQSPCHLFWILARVTTFQFTYILEPSRGPRLFRLSKATAKTVVSFPFYAVRQKHWLTIDKYEPRTARGTAPKNPRPSLSPRGEE